MFNIGKEMKAKMNNVTSVIFSSWSWLLNSGLFAFQKNKNPYLYRLLRA